MTATAVTHTVGPARLVAHTVEIQPPAERAHLLDHLGPDGVAWFADDVSFVTSGIAASSAPDNVASLLESIDRVGDAPHPAAGPLAAGALPFDGPGLLVVPSVTVGVTSEGAAWMTTVAPDGAAPPHPTRARRPAAASSFFVESRPDSRGWERQVLAALALIAEGAIEKVVLAREVHVEADRNLDRSAVLSLLLRTQPGCTVYAHGGFVGATPELLVARRGVHVMSQPMAGSIPAGLHADKAAVSGLLTSAKESVEHSLLVDAVRCGLSPLATRVDVGVPEAVRFATVTHLATRVGATLRDPATTALDLAVALHPTPAVAGTPRAAALEAIHRLEAFERGRYGGPVGWVSTDGDGEFAVALRCAQIEGSRAQLFAGAGIVAGSDPDAEWDETQAKLEPMLRAIVRP